MKFALIALLLFASPASADELFSLYASGKYEDAMRAGAAANTAGSGTECCWHISRALQRMPVNTNARKR